MERASPNSTRYNLYYIFEADKKEHPMPDDAVERIRKNIFEKNLKIIKPLSNSGPP